jgi:hypothetical protein
VIQCQHIAASQIKERLGQVLDVNHLEPLAEVIGTRGQSPPKCDMQR